MLSWQKQTRIMRKYTIYSFPVCNDNSNNNNNNDNNNDKRKRKKVKSYRNSFRMEQVDPILKARNT